MLCYARHLTLLALVAGFAMITSNQALPGSGTKSAPVGQPANSSNAPTAGEGEAPGLTDAPSLTDAQRQLCKTAFSNGSGTKFSDQAAFDQACMALFPPAFSAQGSRQNES